MSRVVNVKEEDIIALFENEVEKEGILYDHIRQIYKIRGRQALVDWLEDHNFWNVSTLFNMWDNIIIKEWAE